MIETNKRTYIIVVVCLAILSLTFRPGLWLTHKPASTQNAHYVKGWEDGCISGTNSYSLFYAPLMSRPFIKEPDAPLLEQIQGAKENYKTGWNEGFTLCRYYQSAVYELMQFAIVIATVLFVGYLFHRKKT